MVDLSEKNNERIRIAERLGQPDKVPFGATALGTFTCDVAGIKLRDYYMKPEVMYTVQERWRKLLFNIPSFVVDLGVVVEPSILGAEVIWRLDEAPLPKPILKNIEEVDKLESLDVTTSPLVKKAHQIYSFLSKKSRKKVDWNYVLGPVDIACLVRGIREYMVDLYMKPDLAKKLLRKATLVCKDIVKHRLGLIDDVERFMLADDYAGYLNPKVFEELYLPIVRDIYRLLPKKVIRWFHSDGDHIGPSVHLLPQTGAQVFHSFTHKIDLTDLKKKIGEKICISGNIDTIKILRYGTPTDVMKACREAISKAGKNGGYILSSGGELARGTPVENVHAMLLTTSEYGRYPIEPC